LPRSTIVDIRKGQVIYSQTTPSTKIYLVIAGTVKVCRIAGEGRKVLVDIYGPDEFFGESAFVGSSESNEIASVLEYTQVMTWATSEIEQLALAHPQLAIALVQLLTQRTLDCAARIESFALDTIVLRLARALVRFSERLGHQIEDGSVEMIALTHELLSQYLGTSREIISLHMSDLRNKGYLRYSRRGIWLYADAMKDWLNENHVEEAKTNRLASVGAWNRPREFRFTAKRPGSVLRWQEIL
jgi:CRP/FNR family transcriptional regulator, cyclic AMP receptor protein